MVARGRIATIIISVTAAACLPLVAGVSHARASQRAVQASWGKAVEVPGLATLNSGGNTSSGAAVSTVSCASQGFCGAGGTYTDAAGHLQVFVVNKTHGTWGKAIEVPGMAALNTGGLAFLHTISCPSPGNCAAGGYYSGPGAGANAYVVNEVNGVWHRAIAVQVPVPGEGSQAISVSCASAGNCSAVGDYGESTGDQAFVANEKDGVWHRAIEVPGSAALNVGNLGFASAVSCAAPGNCTAGGQYTDSSSSQQAFVVGEVNGVWGTAIELPGSAADGGITGVTSIACTSPGTCAAAGYGGEQFTFVANEVNGTWAGFHNISNMASPVVNDYSLTDLTPVSCGSAGNCSLGSTGPYPTFNSALASEVNGTWGSGFEPAGDAALNGGISAGIDAMSCPSAGNCSAGGYATKGNGVLTATVVGQAHGTWGTEIELPGIAALNAGRSAALSSISCSWVNHCAGGGFYTDAHGVSQGFVVNQS